MPGSQLVPERAQQPLHTSARWPLSDAGKGRVWVSPFHEEAVRSCRRKLTGEGPQTSERAKKNRAGFGPNSTGDSSTSVHVRVCDAVRLLQKQLLNFGPTAAPHFEELLRTPENLC